MIIYANYKGFGFFGHPEVNTICLIILLIAGNTLISTIYNIKDSIRCLMMHFPPLFISRIRGEIQLYLWSLNNVIDLILSNIYSSKLYFILKGLSAGNFPSKVTSETKSNNINKYTKDKALIDLWLYNKEISDIKDISIHMPKHTRINNDKDLGHYLAGVLDSNGHIFNNNLVIEFNNDYSFIYLIKKQIGYGSVIKGDIPKLIIKSNGIPKVLNLINNKIYNKILYSDLSKYIELNNIDINFSMASSKDDMSNILETYWLCGYLDMNSTFNIDYSYINSQLINVKYNLYIKPPVNDKYNINNDILLRIYSTFKGYIFTDENNEVVYNINNIDSVYGYLSYLRRYNLMSNKYLCYLYWRKIYIRMYNIIYYLKHDISNINYYDHSREILKLINYIERLNKISRKYKY